MDKKDIKTYIIIITKIYLVMILGMGTLGNLFVAFMASFTGESFIKNFVDNTISLLGGFLFIGGIIYGAIGLIYLFIMIKRKRNMANTDSYIRDLPEYFPPAIASMLLDRNLEITTDYTATIAYLISKKYIDFVGDEVNVLNSNIVKLSSHEKYTFECITKQRKFDSKEFEKIVIDDAEEMGMVKKGPRKTHFLRNISIAFSILLISGFSADYIKVKALEEFVRAIYVCSVISIFAVIGYSIFILDSNNFHRTKLGNKESIKWKGVKNYLKDYTLLSDRNLEDTVIFDDYIPYAIALGEAKSIEKYIENNVSYRKLIYGKKYSFLKEDYDGTK